MFLKKVSIVASMALILSMGVVNFSNAEGNVQSNNLGNIISINEARTLNGWVKEDWYWTYYKNGEKQYEQWIKENGKSYYVDSFGSMIESDTYLIDGKQYIFNSKGEVIYIKGLVSFEREGYYEYGEYIDWYYSNGDGTVKTEQWIKENGKWYYAISDGRLICDQAYLLDGKWYMFDKDGAMIADKGWVNIRDPLYGDRQWYYSNGDGTFKTGWMKENNKWYYFNTIYEGYAAGIMRKNTVSKMDKLYVFSNSGAMVEKKGWISTQINDGSNRKLWHYGNGDGTVKSYQWIKDNGKWYYVDGYGYMVSESTYPINGKDYIFDANGVCLNP